VDVAIVQIYEHVYSSQRQKQTARKDRYVQIKKTPPISNKIVHPKKTAYELTEHSK